MAAGREEESHRGKAGGAESSQRLEESSQFPVLSSQKNLRLSLRTENWEPRTRCHSATLSASLPWTSTSNIAVAASLTGAIRLRRAPCTKPSASPTPI